MTHESRRAEMSQAGRFPRTMLWFLTVACLSLVVGWVMGYASGKGRAQDDVTPYKAQAEALGREREQLIGRLQRQGERLARRSYPKRGRSPGEWDLFAGRRFVNLCGGSRNEHR